MAVYEIPLSPRPQTMAIALGGAVYRLRFFFANVCEAGWALDISDAGGNPLICGIPLVAGDDLLAQYPDVGIAGRLFVRSDDPATPPGFADLGVSFHVYFEPS